MSDAGSAALNYPEDVAELGTRFRIFPQPSFIPGYEEPEIVWISTPPTHIQPGPADPRMYVVDPIGSKEPYEFPYLPPFKGALHAPAEADADGHFDHLDSGSRQFLAAHSYACVRRTLDIFEGYAGRVIPWFFEPTYDRLEIVPLLLWDNAQSGYGYLEMGEDGSLGKIHPFALNFDAISHEIGHLILFGTLGVPERTAPSREFFGYHEAVADYISLIGLLHFDTVLDRVLRRTRGNLLLLNELDRFAELSHEKQIRSFNHALKLRDVGMEVHDHSKPFAGALFDMLIELYQWLLYERGLSELNPRDFRDLRRELPQAEFDRMLSISSSEYALKHFAVKAALADARDIVGRILVDSWSRMDVDAGTFYNAAGALIEASEEIPDRGFAKQVFDVFAWREIV